MPLSALGYESISRILKESTWNNSEPEAVLVYSSGGTVICVTIGNDLSLRDFEGRFTLLLYRAEDDFATKMIVGARLSTRRSG